MVCTCLDGKTDSQSKGVVYMTSWCCNPLLFQAYASGPKTHWQFSIDNPNPLAPTFWWVEQNTRTTWSPTYIHTV